MYVNMFLLIEVDVYQIIYLSMYIIYLQVVSIKLYTEIRHQNLRTKESHVSHNGVRLIVPSPKTPHCYIKIMIIIGNNNNNNDNDSDSDSNK